MTKNILLGVVGVLALIFLGGWMVSAGFVPILDASPPPVFPQIADDLTTTTTRPPTTTSTTRAPRPPTTTMTLSTSTIEAIFVDTMRGQSATYSQWTWVDSWDDVGVIDWGYEICDDIDRFGLFDALEVHFTTGELVWGDAWYPVDEELLVFGAGAAAFSFCPWNTDLFDGGTDE